MKQIAIIIMVIIAIFFWQVYLNLTVPSDVGVVNGKLKPLPWTPNAVSSQTDDTARYVEPFVLYENSHRCLLEIISEIENAEIVTDEAHYIHAVFKSPMGFRDDVEFYFDEKASVVHFRSASRVGYSDQGVNRNRYEQLKELYEKSVQEN